jgi:hypothetical protein
MKLEAIAGWHDPRIRAKPVAPLADFEAWLSNRNRSRHTHYISAQAIRRAVIMRKQGESWKDCGLATGHKGAALKAIIEFLPLELQP